MRPFIPKVGRRHHRWTAGKRTDQKTLIGPYETARPGKRWPLAEAAQGGSNDP